MGSPARKRVDGCVVERQQRIPIRDASGLRRQAGSAPPRRRAVPAGRSARVPRTESRGCASGSSGRAAFPRCWRARRSGRHGRTPGLPGCGRLRRARRDGSACSACRSASAYSRAHADRRRACRSAARRSQPAPTPPRSDGRCHWIPASSGEFQSRSVGPLPATITTAGNGPGPDGLTNVPYTVVASNGHVISTLSPDDV